MIGLLAATAAGRVAAEELSGRWPDTRRYDVAELETAWRDCSGLVCFLAVGATVRLLARLLVDKRTDPPVVCVDEARRYAVALLGGHAGGNALAERVADALGAVPVLTTATDATGVTALDTLGWPVEGDVAAVTAAVLAGEPVALRADARWPLPALPPGVREDVDHPAATIVISDRVDARPADPVGPVVVLRPPSLVVGVGASRGAPVGEILALVDAALADAGLCAGSVRALATVDAKADEPGLLEAARRRGWPLRSYPAGALATVAVPNPSAVVQAAVGTPSVAEAAALTGGPARLLVPKRATAHATVAVARHAPRGRLALVGLGPGARDLLTPLAVTELRRASIVLGLAGYLDQIRDLLAVGTEIRPGRLGAEEERARTAVELAREGRAVALVSGGDVGVYAMASPALCVAGADIDVTVVPGVTAALAAAALLGAPLGHDHCAISLSDLHTPWEVIENRVRAAAVGDFVVTLYNPRSRRRDWQLPAALRLLAEHRPATTPVGLVTAAGRPEQRIELDTLGRLDPSAVDMSTLVIVGNSQSRVVAGRFVTPRGYPWS